jgi:hypothetical protein
MADPDNAGKHPYHDARWIATADAEVEYGYDLRSRGWSLRSGSLIAEMRDGHLDDARLIASAPELLAALQRFASAMEQRSYPELQGIACDAFAAIAKATGSEVGK